MNDWLSFLEATPDAVIVIDRAAQIIFANSRVEPFLGYLPSELVGQPLSVLVPMRYCETHAVNVQRFFVEPTARMMGVGLSLFAMRKDGSEFKTEISLSPYQIPEGPIVIAAMRDSEALHASKTILETENAALKQLLDQARLKSITLLAQGVMEANGRKADQQSQALLLDEVHHRIKNLLALFAGITSQTLKASQSLDEGRQAILKRLDALGRAQDLLLQGGESGVSLADIVRAAVAPFDNHQVPKFTIKNATIQVGVEAILPISMSLNELCTNAVKYGALSNEMGHVDIASTVDEATKVFTLAWTETGGPIVKAPTKHSFGTRLLSALAKQLHGIVAVRYDPIGVAYQLEVPLANLAALHVS